MCPGDKTNDHGTLKGLTILILHCFEGPHYRRDDLQSLYASAACPKFWHRMVGFSVPTFLWRW